MNSIRVLKAVYGGDVGMVEGGQKLSLSLEAGQTVTILGELSRQNLDGDFRFRVVSSARYTSPMPPSPSFSKMR